MNQQELNKVCSRLEKRLEFLEQRMIDLGDYTEYRRKKSEQLLQEYNSIQDKISFLCSEFRRNN
ncbi:MAG: hypothetical protein K0S93_69 [Nitrososphaeraceae archaeon]|nr:hypothetical protein [Nitrososphaeraceae archaeon]